MRHISRNILVRLAVVLCAAVQIAFLMPHHHHEGNDYACINPLHCVGSADTDCGNHIGHHACAHFSSPDACAGHSHDTEDDQCALSHIELIVPGSERNQIQTLQPTECLPFAVLTADLTFDPESLSDAALCVHSGLPGTESVYTEWIVQATPSRAPSFAV